MRALSMQVALQKKASCQKSSWSAAVQMPRAGVWRNFSTRCIRISRQHRCRGMLGSSRRSCKRSMRGATRSRHRNGAGSARWPCRWLVPDPSLPCVSTPVETGYQGIYGLTTALAHWMAVRGLHVATGRHIDRHKVDVAVSHPGLRHHAVGASTHFVNPAAQDNRLQAVVVV
jgi:hypothetical protein